MKTLSPEEVALIRSRLKAKGVGDDVPSDAIPVRTETGPAPLSLGQEGLWFIHRLDPKKPAYNIPGLVRLEGALDVAALEASLDHLLRRHDSLRTVFDQAEDGTPVQVVRPPTQFHLEVFDLTQLSKTDREAEVVRRARGDAATPFDLGRGPLFTAFLLRLDVAEHALVLKVHHLVIDGWSWGILTRELRELYGALSRGEPIDLPPLRLTYADFAVWQRKWLTGKVYEELVTYWTGQLSGASPLELPTDRSRPSVQTYRGMHTPIQFSRAATDTFRRMAREEGRTLFVVLLAAFNILMHRYSGQEDIVVGATFANRNRTELEDLIGYFVTLLPLRCAVTPEADGRELLRRVSETTAGAIANQALPLTKLVNELGLKKDTSRPPLFQVVFYLLTPDRNPAVFGFGLPGTYETIEMEDIRLTPIETECELARFDVMFLLWDLPDGLRGTVEYSTDIFDESTIVEMVEGFELVLRDLVSRPEAAVRSFVDRLDRELGRRRAAREAEAKHKIGARLGQIRARRARSGGEPHA